MAVGTYNDNGTNKVLTYDGNALAIPPIYTDNNFVGNLWDNDGTNVGVNKKKWTCTASASSITIVYNTFSQTNTLLEALPCIIRIRRHSAQVSYDFLRYDPSTDQFYYTGDQGLHTYTRNRITKTVIIDVTLVTAYYNDIKVVADLPFAPYKSMPQLLCYSGDACSLNNNSQVLTRRIGWKVEDSEEWPIIFFPPNSILLGAGTSDGWVSTSYKYGWPELNHEEINIAEGYVSPGCPMSTTNYNYHNYPIPICLVRRQDSATIDPNILANSVATHILTTVNGGITYALQPSGATAFSSVSDGYCRHTESEFQLGYYLTPFYCSGSNNQKIEYTAEHGLCPSGGLTYTYTLYPGSIGGSLDFKYDNQPALISRTNAVLLYTGQQWPFDVRARGFISGSSGLTVNITGSFPNYRIDSDVYTCFVYRDEDPTTGWMEYWLDWGFKSNGSSTIQHLQSSTPQFSDNLSEEGVLDDMFTSAARQVVLTTPPQSGDELLAIVRLHVSTLNDAVDVSYTISSRVF